MTFASSIRFATALHKHINSSVSFVRALLHFKKIIPADIAYTDLKYTHVISLTGIYQGGIILWVAFWCFYGQGFNQETFYNVGVFSLAYSTVIGIECLLDVGLLATLKSYKKTSLPSVFNNRLISVKE